MTTPAPTPHYSNCNPPCLSRERDGRTVAPPRLANCTYSCPVDRTTGGDNPDLDAFARWVQRVLDHYKGRGWSVSRISRESGVGRTIIYRWLAADPDEGLPTRPTVERFCDGLGIPKTEPYALFGWVEPTEVDPVPLPPAIDDDVQAVQDIITRHDLTPDEVDEVRAALRMIRGRFQQRDPNGGQRQVG